MTDLREKLAAGTPGPWWVFGTGEDECGEVDPHPGIEAKEHSVVLWGDDDETIGVARLADAELIVAAVNELPGLLDEIDRLKARIDEMELADIAYRNPGIDIEGVKAFRVAPRETTDD